MQRSEKEKIRKRNCQGEMIYRTSDEYFYPIATPKRVAKEPYPWEVDGNLPKITKDFFRCKGSSLHAPVRDLNDTSEGALYSDCDGGERHGLPNLGGKEGVYPILLDLLNYVQKKTGKRVIITSGHRCPSHNSYVDPSKENQTSKHQIGAEVDFYVQGMEDRPLEIVALLIQYYQETPIYQNQKEYLNFVRYEKPDAHVAMQPWMNKEVYIKLNQKGEGRNFDNQHPHPYLTIQVRFDREKGEKVIYKWQLAHNGYSKGW